MNQACDCESSDSESEVSEDSESLFSGLGQSADLNFFYYDEAGLKTSDELDSRDLLAAAACD